MSKRTIKQLLRLENSYDMTAEEHTRFKKWLCTNARTMYDGYDYCCLIGWFVLNDRNCPLSPKEAGFD
ncbi:MAG: hypothetical protein GY861_04650 [bacterium]|nr:hypothetical protein [bacterium]